MSSINIATGDLISEFMRQSSMRDTQFEETLNHLQTMVIRAVDDDSDDDSCPCVSKVVASSELSTFAGTESVVEARTWLRNFDHERELRNWTEVFTLKVARRLLIQDAATWVESIDADKLATWRKFKIEFGVRYGGKVRRAGDEPIMSLEDIATARCNWDSMGMANDIPGMTNMMKFINEFSDEDYESVLVAREARRNSRREKQTLKKRRQLLKEQLKKERNERIEREANNMATIDENGEKMDN